MNEILKIDQPCPLEIECPEAVHRPGPASLELTRYLFNVRGKRVLDLGCGTGLLALACAKLGAREVWATDIDPAAVECARRNAERNGVALQVRQGSLFEPVLGDTFDLIVTNPPQTPAPALATGPKFAGEDGLRHFRTILREAPRQLTDGGVLLTFLISLADTRRFEALLGEAFRFRALPTSRRYFTRGEFDTLHPGLFEFQADRRRQGLGEFAEEEDGRLYFTVRYYMAMKK